MPKYGNKRTTVDGIVFASKRESERYRQLCILKQVGEIRDLVLQPRYPLVVNGLLVCTYVGDFRYTDVLTGLQIVEDSKGFRTREYILKKKLLKALTGIEVQEV